MMLLEFLHTYLNLGKEFYFTLATIYLSRKTHLLENKGDYMVL